jgi:hypothetical protein
MWFKKYSQGKAGCRKKKQYENYTVLANYFKYNIHIFKSTLISEALINRGLNKDTLNKVLNM